MKYVTGEYGIGGRCGLHVAENVDGTWLNGDSCSLGACCTATEDWEHETCDAGIPIYKIHLKSDYTLIFFKKQEKIKLDFIWI